MCTYFTLGVSAYRIRFYVLFSSTIIKKTFRIFRQSVYNESTRLKLKELKKLSGELEIDEPLFGVHSKGKLGRESEGKYLVFEIY